MPNIKYFRLFSNDNERSKVVEEKVRDKLVKNNFIEDKDNYDLAIAELEKTMFVLQHINDKYKFNLENIF